MRCDRPHSDINVALRKRRRLTLATVAAGSAGVVGATIPLLASLRPSERAKSAGAPVQTNIAQLAPGQLVTMAWRGKPVWILRRTDRMILRLRDHDHLLLDPQSAKSRQPTFARNLTRSLRPEIFVAVALCTHLGCIPTMRQDVAPTDLGPAWPGGFFCPCHGSKFDFAGRVFRNVPAPTNLEIPPHDFVSASHLQIGDGAVMPRS